MRIADGNNRCPEEQRHPPGNADKRWRRIAFNSAIHVKSIQRGANSRSQHKKPEQCSTVLHIAMLLSCYARSGCTETVKIAQRIDIFSEKQFLSCYDIDCTA